MGQVKCPPVGVIKGENFRAGSVRFEEAPTKIEIVLAI